MFTLTNEMLVAAARARVLDPATPIPFAFDATAVGSVIRHTDHRCPSTVHGLAAVTAADLATGRDVFTDPGEDGWLLCRVCSPTLDGFATLTAPGTGETLAWLSAADRVLRDPDAGSHPADIAGAASFLLTVRDLLDIDPSARRAVVAGIEGLAECLQRAVTDPRLEAGRRQRLRNAAASAGRLPAGAEEELSEETAAALTSDRVWATLSLTTALTWGISFPADLLHAGFHGDLDVPGFAADDRLMLLTLPRVSASAWGDRFPDLCPLAEATWTKRQLRAAVAVAGPGTVDAWARLARLLPAVAASESAALRE